MILGKIFEGKKPPLIAQELRVSPGTIAQRIAKPAFKRAIETTEAAILERVARGEFGTMAIAKANTVGAMRRLVGQARHSPDERVKFQANLALLKFGGIKEPAPTVVETPERLIDVMTAEELDHFAKTGQWPERLADQLARLATSVLKETERRRWAPQIEHVLPHEQVTEEPHRAMPREEED